MEEDKKIKNLFNTNPKELANFLNQLIEEFQDPQQFYEKYYYDIIEHVEVDGVGFLPVAFTMGGLFSIAGAVVIYLAQREHLKYLITSPEVVEGKGPFSLSNKYLEAFKKAGLKVVVVPFNDIPKYEDAEKILNILKEGAIIVQGVSAEFAMWLGRNAGIGRLIVYRPVNGKGIFRYI